MFILGYIFFKVELSFKQEKLTEFVILHFSKTANIKNKKTTDSLSNVV